MAKEAKMRLTVFNIKEINISEYQKSYDRIIKEVGIEPPQDQTTFVAIFNGSILGISSAKNQIINYFYVLEITRNRGVGSYLLSQTIAKLLEKYPSVLVNKELCKQHPKFLDFINMYQHNDLEFVDFQRKKI